VVAAGSGSRLGGGLPKQYRTIAGQPVLRRSLATFCRHPGVDRVRVVIGVGHEQIYRRCVEGMSLQAPVEGGQSRQESVLRGLRSLCDEHPDIVLIHDAARPFADEALVSRVIEALGRERAVIPALAVVDTLKTFSGPQRRFVVSGASRETMVRAQTPQGFHFDAILQAHEALADRAFTDDAAVAEHAGIAVALVPGAEGNVKLTTEEDWMRAEQMLHSAADIRTGSGFDVHRFGPGDHVVLCGLRIPHSAGLMGHSDADVALHALTDALLGAIAAGDIGTHFPPSEERWRGAASDVFLGHAKALVDRAGGTILNVDLTIICEAPRLGPYRQRMRARLADILDVDVDRVSIKATTTEGLGFTGRGEGVAAQAVATVRR
jgi:2-C-methyl-D-erythritol 4-phosphate cytidylyltransferase/2-C-methyl-D-erythritol 2,4-cyclodiphosphate synthase